MNATAKRTAWAVAALCTFLWVAIACIGAFDVGLAVAKAVLQ